MFIFVHVEFVTYNNTQRSFRTRVMLLPDMFMFMKMWCAARMQASLSQCGIDDDLVTASLSFFTVFKNLQTRMLRAMAKPMIVTAAANVRMMIRILDASLATIVLVVVIFFLAQHAAMLVFIYIFPGNDYFAFGSGMEKRLESCVEPTVSRAVSSVVDIKIYWH